MLVRRPTWRLMRGLEPLSPAVFEAWNGLLEGALAVHDRFLLLEVTSRLDWQTFVLAAVFAGLDRRSGLYPQHPGGQCHGAGAC